MMTPEGLRPLAEPFRLSEIEFKVGKVFEKDGRVAVLAMAYVTNRAIQQRLDDVCGPGGWQNSFKPWKEKSVLAGIGIWVQLGQQPGETIELIVKCDGADESDYEATKGGFSNSMKRAAVQWGIGRYLYQFPSFWCEGKKKGKSAVFADPMEPYHKLAKKGYPADYDDISSEGKKPEALSDIPEIKAGETTTIVESPSEQKTESQPPPAPTPSPPPAPEEKQPTVTQIIVRLKAAENYFADISQKAIFDDIVKAHIGEMHYATISDPEQAMKLYSQVKIKVRDIQDDMNSNKETLFDEMKGEVEKYKQENGLPSGSEQASPDNDSPY